MTKKDFTINTGSHVFNAIAEATAEPETEEAQEVQQPQEVQQKATRKTYTPEEIQEMREAGTTHGRKGCKALRINMAFTPTIHEYITTMARMRGETITQFVNHVFQQNMADNAEVYKQAKELQKAMK